MALPKISQAGVDRAAVELELMHAARQLAESTRGRDALRRVVDWLEESGLGLDQNNQQATLTLLEHAWAGYAGTVRDVMHEVLGDYN